jgi:DMSO reductase anchor subunit
VVEQRDVATSSRCADGENGKGEKGKGGGGEIPLFPFVLFSPAASWLPDSPSPAITLPATRYVSAKPFGDLRAADHFDPKPAHAHWPLMLMLVLSQAGMGGLLASAFAAPTTGLPWMSIVSFGLLSAGLLASVFHLGQPAKAWRVWLGWRTSWLSREAIALNTFAGVATALLAAHWLSFPEALKPTLRVALIASSIAALIAQIMVYADTRRAFWRFSSTGPRFCGTAIVLGLALQLAFQPTPSIALALMLATLVKVGVEVRVLKQLDVVSDRWTQLRRTAILQTGALRPLLCVRLLAALAGGVVIPFCVLAGSATQSWIILGAALCVAGELAERYLFFTSVSPDKMPGQL